MPRLGYHAAEHEGGGVNHKVPPWDRHELRAWDVAGDTGKGVNRTSLKGQCHHQRGRYEIFMYESHTHLSLIYMHACMYTTHTDTCMHAHMSLHRLGIPDLKI